MTLRVKHFALIFLFAISRSEFVRPEHGHVSHHLSHDLHKNINENVNPCDDFYEYACGNFEKYETFPVSNYDLFSRIEKKVHMDLKESIEHIEDTDLKVFRTLKSYYHTCINEDLDKKHNEHFMEILNRVGKWPLLHRDSWADSDFDWQRHAEKFRLHGFSYNWFVGFEIGVDMKNNSHVTIQVDQPSFGTYQEYLVQGFEHHIVQKYYYYLVDLAVMLGANKDHAKEELRKVLNFEIALAKISFSNAQRRDWSAFYHLETVSDLQSHYSFVSWREFFNHMMHPHTTCMPNEYVNVRVPGYLRAFGKLIEETPKRVQANYAFLRAVAEFAPYLSEEVRHLKMEFEASVTGNKYIKSRWEQCIDHVNEKMYIATDSLYVRHNFHNESKREVLGMVHHVKNSFRWMIRDADWMEHEAKKAAMEKLDNLLPMIAYSEKLFNDHMVNDYYMSVEIHHDNFVKTVIELNKFIVKHDLEKLRKPHYRNEWAEFTRAAVAKTYYSPLQNAIQYSAGILQGEMFSLQHPRYLNYGAVGANIGHQISTGFADYYRKFDKYGNLFNWWDPKTEEEFTKKAQCFVDQYNSYHIEGTNMNVDGHKTRGPNMADNIGLKVAYHAYRNWHRSQYPEESLEHHLARENKVHTPEQMFWISYANSWCTKFHPESLLNYVITEPYAPAKYRVIGAVSNMPEFAEDFHCPVGSKMNPHKRCTVW